MSVVVVPVVFVVPVAAGTGWATAFADGAAAAPAVAALAGAAKVSNATAAEPARRLMRVVMDKLLRFA
jgi:hypothetical protein